MAKGGQSRKEFKRAAPGMREAWRLYEAGDVYAARKFAQKLLEGTPAEDEAAEARELLERTRFPRQALILAGVALGLFLALVLIAVFRS